MGETPTLSSTPALRAFDFWAGRCQFIGAVLFEPRDLWLGVYWDKPRHRQILKVYICVLPTLPVRLTVNWEPRW